MVAVTVEAAVGAATTAVLMAVAALAAVAVAVTRAVNLWIWTAARERVRRMTRHLWLQ